MSPAAGTDVPLLPSNNHPKKHASIPGAVFNVSTSIIGAGIMSIPMTLKVLGVVPAILLIVAVGFLVDMSVEFLLRYTKSGDSASYSGVMREAFGPFGSLLLQFSIIITNFGCLTMFMIIMGDVLSGKSEHLGVLQEWFGFHWWNTRPFALLIILVIVLLPLVLFRRVETLRFSSAIAVLLAVVFVAISSALAIYALVKGEGNKKPRMLPSLNGNTSVFDLFTAVPVIVTAFTFHFNVHPISNEMGKSSRMISAVRISLILCGGIYFAIGLFGYLLFGESVVSDILVNFDQSLGSVIGSVLNDAVRLSYALHLMMVFPLLNFSLRVNVGELLFPADTLPAMETARFLSITFAPLVLSYLAAIVLPSIWFFFQFMGSTSAVCLAFIFPGALVLRDVHGISTTVMIILAVVTSTIAISTNIYNLIAGRGL